MCSNLILVIISFWTISDAVFPFQCPVQSNWNHRANSRCESFDSYFCLYDKNEKKLVDFCRDNGEIEAPGYKLVVAGSFEGTLDGDACDNDFYQPFKFVSSGNSHCVYQKSHCSEEGQVVFGNGTLQNDRLCRCDYTKGYDFIKLPKHRCYCEPTEEDCSCYPKICSAGETVSPDYECLNENVWKSSFTCTLIETVGSPGNSKIPSTVKQFFGSSVSVNFEIAKYRKGVSLLILFIIIINVGICIFTSEYFSLRKINCFTDKGENDDNIATYMVNENTEKEEKVVASDAEKQELQDKFRNLKNDILKVPSHIKEFQDETLQDWGRKLNKIVITRAIEFIYQKILKRNVIVIAGPTGSGKSAIAYYAAFRLQKESGYTIIPARQSVDITNYHVQGTKQVFILDNFIGQYAVDETDVGIWEKNEPVLKMILSKNDDTKLILTSRTYILQSERYSCLSLDACLCDLLSDHISLSLTERRDICQSYLNQDEVKALKDKTLMMYSFFPSICSSYESSQNISVESFFAVPGIMIEKEIDNFKIKSPVSFMVLAILAMKKTISKNSFSIDNRKYDELIKDVFDESAFLQYPSKNVLKTSLFALTGTYVKHVVKNDTDNFMFDHKTLQKIVLRCIAKTLIKSVIKYCKTKVLLNQLRLDCIHIKQNDFTIEVAVENEEAYFRRLIHEMGEGWNKVIFLNEQNEFYEFRMRFLKYMKTNLSRGYWTKKQDGMSALHVVSSLGYQDYTSFFIKDHAMINQKDSDGNIPLHLACMKGDINIVKILVRNKSLINIENNEGLKPFVYACENNAITVALFLLHYCAKWIDVNEKYPKRNYQSVLHIVCAKGLVNLVLALLQNNAKVDIQDASGCTPLHVANSSAVAKALVDDNANINQVDDFGRSPLYLACSTKQERVAELLIANKAEINQKTKTELRPLHAACQSESIEIVRILVKNGARINSAKPGISPLHEACRVGNESIVNVLIESNASINHKTKDGLTPLHKACIYERVIVAKKLLDSRANVNEESKYGWTALHFSSARGFRTIVDLLLQHGAYVNIWDEDKVSPLMAACKENKTDVVDLLLHSKANVNHCDKDNCSSLLVACKSGNVDLVNLLLTYGADINLADNDMISPLHAACMNTNNTKLVLKLVESNANVHVVDKSGQTPLFKSIFNGSTDIVDILIRHGASVEVFDKSGNSPVSIAKIKGNKTVIDALRQYRPIK